jgi:hypothetical protein
MKIDMCGIPYRSEFDAVISLSSSFGRLPGDRESLRILDATRESLRVGGKLLMDLVNREWLIRLCDPKARKEAHDARVSIAGLELFFDFENGRLEEHQGGVSYGGSRASGLSLRIYALTEIKNLISCAGMEYRQVWGDFDGTSYTLDSPRMIVLAERSPGRKILPKPEEFVSALRIKGRRKTKTRL